MARFLKHIACPKCGSSDANGVYDDGSTYCFSCQGFKSANVSPYVTQQNTTEVFHEAMCYPSDATKDYSIQAVAWCEKYEIGVQQLLENNIYFSPSRNQLIFGFEDGKGNLLAWQARNLSPVNKSKRYFTKGNINNVLPIYYSRNDSGNGSSSLPRRLAGAERSLVLVEDCLSAIKIAALGRDAMPLLGSGISLQKLTRLRPFYDVLAVFLDPDMWHKGLSIARSAQLLGFSSRAIKGTMDPKEYSYSDLKEILND